jgi:selenocysteine lyase/cysteine desulfurase
MEPAVMAEFLGDHGVFVWSGHSYALPVVEWLGIADRGGVVRIGPTHYTTLEEVDTAVGLVAEYLGRR